MRRWLPRIGLGALTVVVAASLVATARGPAPLPVGGALAPCPPSPNCVSSQADPADRVHHVAPFPLHGDPATASERLVAAARSVGRVRTAVVVGDQVRIAFRARSWVFTDDVDLVVDRAAGVVHVRSSSRIGYGDLGANRQRVEALRTAWAEGLRPR